MLLQCHCDTTLQLLEGQYSWRSIAFLAMPCLMCLHHFELKDISEHVVLVQQRCSTFAHLPVGSSCSWATHVADFES